MLLLEEYSNNRGSTNRCLVGFLNEKMVRPSPTCLFHAVNAVNAEEAFYQVSCLLPCAKNVGARIPDEGLIKVGKR